MLTMEEAMKQSAMRFAAGEIVKGTVIEVKNRHSVVVLPDGYKKPHSYFHGYWEPASK